MRFQVAVDDEYPYPIEKVWAAITDRKALSEWCLETDDFKPEVGCRFDMYCTMPDGSVDTYHMEILEMQPPHRMRWSWVLAGNENQGLTEVEFLLSETDTGTRITIRHSGDRDLEMLQRLKVGWPDKLAALGDLLAKSR